MLHKTKKNGKSKKKSIWKETTATTKSIVARQTKKKSIAIAFWWAWNRCSLVCITNIQCIFIYLKTVYELFFLLHIKMTSIKWLSNVQDQMQLQTSRFSEMGINVCNVLQSCAVPKQRLYYIAACIHISECIMQIVQTNDISVHD